MFVRFTDPQSLSLPLAENFKQGIAL